MCPIVEKKNCFEFFELSLFWNCKEIKKRSLYWKNLFRLVKQCLLKNTETVKAIFIASIKKIQINLKKNFAETVRKVRNIYFKLFFSFFIHFFWQLFSIVSNYLFFVHSCSLSLSTHRKSNHSQKNNMNFYNFSMNVLASFNKNATWKDFVGSSFRK